VKILPQGNGAGRHTEGCILRLQLLLLLLRVLFKFSELKLLPEDIASVSVAHYKYGGVTTARLSIAFKEPLLRLPPPPPLSPSPAFTLRG